MGTAQDLKIVLKYPAFGSCPAARLCRCRAVLYSSRSSRPDELPQACPPACAGIGRDVRSSWPSRSILWMRCAPSWSGGDWIRHVPAAARSVAADDGRCMEPGTAPDRGIAGRRVHAARSSQSLVSPRCRRPHRRVAATGGRSAQAHRLRCAGRLRHSDVQRENISGASGSQLDRSRANCGVRVSGPAGADRATLRPATPSVCSFIRQELESVAVDQGRRFRSSDGAHEEPVSSLQRCCECGINRGSSRP